MQISGTVARVAYAILAAIIAYIIVIVVARLLKINEVQAYAGIIAVLVGIVTFFGAPHARIH